MPYTPPADIPFRRSLAIAILDDGRERRELARAAGLTPTAFSGIVTGRVRHPRPETRAAIARVLSRDEAELFPELVTR